MIAKNVGVRKKTSVVWSVITSTIVALWTLLLSPSVSFSSELQLGVDTVRFAMTHTRNYVAQGNEDRIGMIADIAAGMGASSFDDFGRASVKFAKANADNVTSLAAKHAARHFAVQAGGMTAGAGVGAAYGYSQGGWEGAIDSAFSGAQIGSMLGGIGADLLVACFAAGTPLVVGFDGSSRPIDEIEVNDLVLARNEFDPNGPLELKRVEEKFVRVAVVMELVIQGQSIKTTAEHPFFVPAQHRFVTAGELKAGDQLVSHDGQLITVASVCSTEAVTTVYNLRVADHHTYFVGGNEWGWDVWVHNANYAASSTSPRLPTRRYGNWLGERGNSAFELNKKTVNALGLESGTVIQFRSGRVDFSDFSQGNFNVRGMTGDHDVDLPLIHDHIARRMGLLKRDGAPNAGAARRWLTENNLTPHHAGNNSRIQLIDSDLHATIRHTGGAFDLRT